MNNASPQIAVFGLAVMGSNLARNIQSRGFPVVVYNRSKNVTEDFMSQYATETRNTSSPFIAAYSIEELISILKPPRKIILMIQAGNAVDLVLNDLLPFLGAGDIIIDGGNAFYKDTQRRVKELAAKGIDFLGVGISGGEEGALNGPSIMPGGDFNAWQQCSGLFEAIAAKIDNQPCTNYVGPDGSGHFVKMVHNGIEYADMQLIAESYQVLKYGLNLNNERLAEVFGNWNKGLLSSYLMEITASILTKKDPEGEGYLVDQILDKAGQKGTGLWTLLEALQLGVSIPTIAAAVDSRIISSIKDTRIKAESFYQLDRSKYSQDFLHNFNGNTEEAINGVEQALYFGKIIAYAQGLALISQASKEFNWSLKIDQVASLWRAGCIIRASLLKDIMLAFSADPDLENLLLSPYFKEQILGSLPMTRKVCAASIKSGIPSTALCSSVNYFDLITSARLPLNIVQAQRDYFGAHTYERLDKKGVFHTEWNE